MPSPVPANLSSAPPASGLQAAASLWLRAQPLWGWAAIVGLVGCAWLYGALAWAAALGPSHLASGPQLAALRVDIDPQGFVRRLGLPPQVPLVSMTREGAIATELAAHSYSMRPQDAAAAAHALCDTARAEGYDPLLFLAVIAVESSYNHLARSPVGAQGLMQLMPVTAAQLAAEAKMAWRAGMAYDPVANVRLGVRYIAGLHRRFAHHMDWALTAYNRGPGNTRAILAAHHGGLPAPIAAFYAGRVQARYRAFKARYGQLP